MSLISPFADAGPPFLLVAGGVLLVAALAAVAAVVALGYWLTRRAGRTPPGDR